MPRPLPLKVILLIRSKVKINNKNRKWKEEWTKNWPNQKRRYMIGFPLNHKNSKDTDLQNYADLQCLFTINHIPDDSC